MTNKESLYWLECFIMYDKWEKETKTAICNAYCVLKLWERFLEDAEKNLSDLLKSPWATDKNLVPFDFAVKESFATFKTFILDSYRRFRDETEEEMRNM